MPKRTKKSATKNVLPQRTSDDSDDAPDEVGFRKSRSDSLEEEKNIVKVLKIRSDSIKKKRRDAQQRNIMQKEEKLKKLKEKCLPQSVLEKLGVASSSESAITSTKSVEDFIPAPDVQAQSVAVHGTTQFSVRVLPNELKRPEKFSSSAAEFKEKMLYRKQIPREPADKVLAKEEKRKVSR